MALIIEQTADRSAVAGLKSPKNPETDSLL